MRLHVIMLCLDAAALISYLIIATCAMLCATAMRTNNVYECLCCICAHINSMQTNHSDIAFFLVLDIVAFIL